MSALRSDHSRSLELRKNLSPFLLGFLATSFQILILREFEVRHHSNELVYGLVLAFWLLGGGLGSLLAEKQPLQKIKPVWFFSGSLLLSSLIMVFLRFSRFFYGVLPAESINPGAIFISSFLISLLASLPLGALFVANVLWLEGRLGLVYQLESLGAAAGGFLVYLIILPYFSSWQAAALLIFLTGAALLIIVENWKTVFHLLPVFLLLTAFFWSFDLPSEKKYWKPFELLTARDSLHARIQVIRSGDQISYFTSGFLAFNYPDLASAEEAIHFALLQRPASSSLLLVGGGLNGAISQALQYPQLEIDYVELDPELVRLALRFSGQELEVLSHPRVKTYLQDGRRFIQSTDKKYDLVICNLPEPTTAQVNRFYTVEFFNLVKKILKPDGVFSFRLPSSENYLSDERAQLLASIYHSLKQVFKKVEIIPGDNNIFLASEEDLDLRLEHFEAGLSEYGLRTVYFRPEIIQSRLHPLKKAYWLNRIDSIPEPRINSDRSPISYFYQNMIWSRQFRGPVSQLLNFLRGLRRFWLFDLPLLLFVLLTIFILIKKQPGTSSLLLPVTLMGFTTIVAEIGFILSFQARFGLVYSQISLLFTVFMFGLFLGAAAGRRIQPDIKVKPLLSIQAGFVLFLTLARFVPSSGWKFHFYGLLLLMGFLAGYLFVVANTLYLERKNRYGLGYALDLFGSFFGALVTTGLFIPILGLEKLFDFLLLLNSFCLVFLLLRFRSSI